MYLSPGCQQCIAGVDWEWGNLPIFPIPYIRAFQLAAPQATCSLWEVTLCPSGSCLALLTISIQLQLQLEFLGSPSLLQLCCPPGPVQCGGAWGVDDVHGAMWAHGTGGHTWCNSGGREHPSDTADGGAPAQSSAGRGRGGEGRRWVPPHSVQALLEPHAPPTGVAYGALCLQLLRSWTALPYFIPVFILCILCRHRCIGLEGTSWVCKTGCSYVDWQILCILRKFGPIAIKDNRPLQLYNKPMPQPF